MKHSQAEFQLTDKQCEVRKVFATSARYLLVYGGSRSGKTFFVVYAILTRMIKAPGSRHVVFRQDGVDAKQSIGNETVPAVVSLAYPDLVLKWHEKDGYFEAPNGSQLWLAGLKDKARLDKVLGKEFVTIYLNEASQITLEALGVVITRLAQTVRQTDGRVLAQKLYVDLNPTVAAHWTYQMWVLGLRPEDGKPIPDHATEYAHITVNPSDNLENLDPAYVKSLSDLPERMRKRFFDGKYTADDDNALWRRAYIKHEAPPQMKRIVVAVDPATTNTPGSDETGLIVMGLGIDDKGYVLSDDSGRYRPEEWARRAVSMFDTFDADCIVAEVNQGGDMVGSMIAQASPKRVIPYKAVVATRAKQVRAEPIAALYEKGKIRHADQFQTLEDQMCSFTLNFDRKSQGYSPDRVDALVWAATALFPNIAQAKNKPRVSAPPPRNTAMSGRL